VLRWSRGGHSQQRIHGFIPNIGEARCRPKSPRKRPERFGRHRAMLGLVHACACMHCRGVWRAAAQPRTSASGCCQGRVRRPLSEGPSCPLFDQLIPGRPGVRPRPAPETAGRAVRVTGGSEPESAHSSDPSRHGLGGRRQLRVADRRASRLGDSAGGSR
jgi:hypothetical protein